MRKLKKLLLLTFVVFGLAVLAIFARFAWGFVSFIRPSYRLQWVDHLFGFQPTGFESATTRQMTRFLASFYDWPHTYPRRKWNGVGDSGCSKLVLALPPVFHPAQPAAFRRTDVNRQMARCR
jgi:hypothetical protein